MDSTDGLALLGRMALGATAAIVAIALLRRPLRHCFGAPVAYYVWALLPAMTLAAAFGRPDAAAGTPTMVLFPGPAAATATGATAEAAGGIALGPLLLLLWAVGVLVMLAIRIRQQWHWRRALGALRVGADGIARAGAHASLPALAGWPRPCIVLPADFAARFPPAEQVLVVAHERRHLARGDLHAQLAYELLRALLWFHPLLHWAAPRFRHDQELACDAEVLAMHRDAVPDYARALLRATPFPLPPLATSWGSVHPLKERLAMLQLPPRSTRTRRAGSAAIVLLVALCAGVAWATLPRAAAGPASDAVAVPDGKLRQTWTLRIDDGRTIGPLLLVDAPGVPVEIGFEHAGERWTLRSTAIALTVGTFEVQAELLRGTTVVGSPQMVMGDRGGSIAIKQEAKADSASRDPDAPASIVASVKVEAGKGTAMVGAVPRYPDGLAEAGFEGTVILRVDVSAEGRATRVRIEESSGHAALDESARVAAYQWRFNPGMKDGVPVAGEMLVPVKFDADGKPPADG